MGSGATERPAPRSSGPWGGNRVTGNDRGTLGSAARRTRVRGCDERAGPTANRAGAASFAERRPSGDVFRRHVSLRHRQLPPRVGRGREELHHRDHRLRRRALGFRQRRTSSTSISSTARRSISLRERTPPRRAAALFRNNGDGTFARRHRIAPASPTSAGARASASATSTTTASRTSTSPTSAATACTATRAAARSTDVADAGRRRASTAGRPAARSATTTATAGSICTSPAMSPSISHTCRPRRAERQRRAPRLHGARRRRTQAARHVGMGASYSAAQRSAPIAASG